MGSTGRSPGFAPLAILLNVARNASAGLIGARPVGPERSPIRHEILQAEGGDPLLQADLEDQVHVGDDERVRKDHDPVRGLWPHLRQRGPQLLTTARGPVEDFNRKPIGRLSNLHHAFLGRPVAGAADGDQAPQAGDHLLEQLHPFAATLHLLVAYPGNETAGSRERCNEAVSDRVADAGEQDGDRAVPRFLLGGANRRGGDRDDHIHRLAGELPGETFHFRQRAHPQIDNEATTGLARVLLPILDVFELLELVHEPRDVEGFGLPPGLVGPKPGRAGPAAPSRHVARPKRQHADLEWLLRLRRERTDEQQGGDDGANDAAVPAPIARGHAREWSSHATAGAVGVVDGLHHPRKEHRLKRPELAKNNDERSA